MAFMIQLNPDHQHQLAPSFQHFTVLGLNLNNFACYWRHSAGNRTRT